MIEAKNKYAAYLLLYLWDLNEMNCFGLVSMCIINWYSLRMLHRADSHHRRIKAKLWWGISPSLSIRIRQDKLRCTHRYDIYQLVQFRVISPCRFKSTQSQSGRLRQGITFLLPGRIRWNNFQYVCNGIDYAYVSFGNILTSTYFKATFAQVTVPSGRLERLGNNERCVGTRGRQENVSRLRWEQGEQGCRSKCSARN